MHILIEPQWNVEADAARVNAKEYYILIEPQWNVEEDGAAMTDSLILDFNRTIVECRG